MRTTPTPPARDETGTEARILGALVGAVLGAAYGASSTGRPRVPHGSVAGPDLAKAESFARAVEESTPGEWWVVSAVLAGLARRCDPMADFVSGLPLGDRPRLEAAAVASVAAAVSAAVDGCARPEVTSLALMAGGLAGDAATDEPGPDLGARTQWACALAARAEEDPDEVVDLLVGTTAVVQECVPAAFAMLAAHDPTGRPTSTSPDVGDVCARAASLGGAADVIAPIVGAVLGATYGVDALPEDVRTHVDGSWPGLRPLGAALTTSRRS